MRPSSQQGLSGPAGWFPSGPPQGASAGPWFAAQVLETTRAALQGGPGTIRLFERGLYEPKFIEIHSHRSFSPVGVRASGQDSPQTFICSTTRQRPRSRPSGDARRRRPRYVTLGRFRRNLLPIKRLMQGLSAFAVFSEENSTSPPAGHTCFWAGTYVLLGRNPGVIRASGQEHTCFWAGTYVLLGRKFGVSPCRQRVFFRLTSNYSNLQKTTTTARARRAAPKTCCCLLV